MTDYKHKLAVAPMMDWTDRHCRYFHRLLTRKTLLYTEMVVADAVIRGDRERLLGFDETEHPVALQLGGSDPDKLAEAALVAADRGYDEVNLNVGCPSDRVQSGTFGACLMREPELVARCVAAMKSAVSVPVTVKCRLGVDEQDVETALDAVADHVFDAGADALWVHARKAWLDGLSPRENRDIPPLDYSRVRRLKERLPARFIGINGGIKTALDIAGHLRSVDGVMLGRVAYQTPMILVELDHVASEGVHSGFDYRAVVEAVCEYAERHIAGGGRLAHITRHMVGMFHGCPGARRYRQILSTDAAKPGAGTEVLRRAFAEVDLSDAVAAA